MRFSFETTRGDYLEASQALARRQRDWLRPLRWWGLGATAVGFLLFAGDVPHATRIAPIVLMGTGLFAVLYPIWVAYSNLDERWKKIEPFLGVTEVETGECGITFSTPQMHGTWRWEALAEVDETRGLFLLFLAEGKVLASIPKRNLKTPEEIQEFRRTLAEQVRRQVKGFPVVVPGNTNK